MNLGIMTSTINSKKNLILALLLGFCNYIVYSQDPFDNEIRRLEQLQARALINNDTTALGDIWAAGYIVNNADNVVLDRQMALAHVKKVNLHYLSYETQIEKISFVDNIAIVMGQEILQPIGGNHSGKTITRRYTNVWVKIDDSWQITAQQSTTIAVK